MCVTQCIRCPVFPVLGKALVSTWAQAAITNTTGREGLNNRHIPHSSGGQVQGECACTAGSAESSLPGYSRVAERGGSDLSPRMRTPIPPWGPILVASSKPSHLPKAPAPDTTTLGLCKNISNSTGLDLLVQNNNPPIGST